MALVQATTIGMKETAKSLTSDFRLPREHGAVVTFALASLLALKTAESSILACSITLLTMWLCFLSGHHPRRVVFVAIPGSLVACAIAGSLSPALLISAFACGERLALAVAVRVGARWRETLGMLGVAVLPMLAPVASGAPLLAAPLAAFAASAMSACAMVHVLRGDRSGMVVLPLLMATMIAAAFWQEKSSLLAICLLPFALQILLVWRGQKLSFKTVGIIETVAMVWVTSVIWVF